MCAGPVQVTSSQAGEAVFVMTASFQRAEQGLSHSVPVPPDAPPPESLPTQEEVYRHDN